MNPTQPTNPENPTNATVYPTSWDMVQQQVACRDATNPLDRRWAADAMEALIRQFIVPAMPWAEPVPDEHKDAGVTQDEWYLSLNYIAKEEVEGLWMSLFDKRMPTDLQRPSDEALQAALTSVGLNTIADDAAWRDGFYKIWAAQRAEGILGVLYQFLRKNYPKYPPPALGEQLRREKAQCQALLAECRLTMGMEYYLTELIAQCQAVESKWKAT